MRKERRPPKRSPNCQIIHKKGEILGILGILKVFLNETSIHLLKKIPEAFKGIGRGNTSPKLGTKSSKRRRSKGGGRKIRQIRTVTQPGYV